MTAALLLAALLASPAPAAEDPAECPAGTHRVTTANPYEPFRCLKPSEEAKAGFGSVVGPKGFATRPHCPRGTHPEASTNSLQPYRCVRTTGGEKDPELLPMRGSGVGAVASPDAPGAAPRPAPKARPIAASTFVRFTIPGQISFEYSRAFRVQDAWKEDVPTLYLKLEDAGAGKPVTITVTRYEKNQATYQEMESAIARDVEWQGAKAGAATTAAGRPARVTEVARDTRSVYLPITKESYYSFVYSAPADAFEADLPAFVRLLKSLRLDGAAR